MPKTSGDGTPCSKCGSVDTVKNGDITTKRGTFSRRLCNACKHTWYPALEKNACECGLLGCTCNGNIGPLITWADGLDTADLVFRSPKYGKATLEHWSV